MRILIDECVDQRLRLLFGAHDSQTAAYAGFAGLKNGALLAASEAAGFEVMVTMDQEISFQQNLGGRHYRQLRGLAGSRSTRLRMFEEWLELANDPPFDVIEAVL